MTAAAASPLLERAQGIRCGGLAIAVPYRWARNVVEAYTLSAVPLAPSWLAGAANVEGRIVAVVDLAVWATPEATPPAAAKARLLVGGDGAQAFALRFEGLPTLLQERNGLATPPNLPAPLQPYVSGTAQAEFAAPSALPWPLINIEALARQWAEELAR